MQAAGLKIEYGPVTEPWGVTRFYVRDPFERLVRHSGASVIEYQNVEGMLSLYPPGHPLNWQLVTLKRALGDLTSN